MKKNIPNHAQAALIGKSVRLFLQGETPEEWRGGSYRMELDTTQTKLCFIHWVTTIADIEKLSGDDYGKIRVTFDAYYYSATTRSFQGRILSGLEQAGLSVPAVRDELSLPTDKRGDVIYTL